MDLGIQGRKKVVNKLKKMTQPIIKPNRPYTDMTATAGGLVTEPAVKSRPWSVSWPD